MNESFSDECQKPPRGLSHADAARRLKEEGANILPSEKPRNVVVIAVEVVREPMFLLLLAAVGIYFLLGDLAEALSLLAAVFGIIGITFYQQRRTERVLAALRDLSSPRALVIRDGERQRIAGREVVRGDLLVLAEGDRIPADATLQWAVDFEVDESLLTGESVPVRKTPEATEGSESNKVYSGALVVRGEAIAMVDATGERSRLGAIGKSLQEQVPEPAPLQRQITHIVRVVATLSSALCVLLVLLYGFLLDDWLAAILAGITLAMAILPVEFPVVVTVFLALGAWRIAKQRVLTRHAAAIEALGKVTVLCVDKTGTLTENRMSLQRLVADNLAVTFASNNSAALSEPFRAVVEYSILASKPDPYDPMEKSLWQAGKQYMKDSGYLNQQWRTVHEYGLTSHLMAVTRIWRDAEQDRYIVAAKGAPEAIAKLCGLDEVEHRQLEVHINSMAQDGLRVLGVAKAHGAGPPWPAAPDFAFQFLGLVGLADPLRVEVPAAIAECHKAGIRVVMITGDYPQTARTIARQAGLLPGSEGEITGAELNRLSDAEITARLKNANVFARIVPEQKLRLVNLLKANGEIVAMTGDGVNDAPALRAAHIGVAMGGRGTDVAREAASLVLLDDDFTSIIKAVKLGRRIFDNLQKAMAYIVAVHIPIAGMSILPILFGWPLMFAPIHIVFTEFVIDPACSIAYEAEPEEEGIMRRPPRPPNAPLLGSRLLMLSCLQGLGALAVVLAVYGMSLAQNFDENQARTLAFITLILTNLFLILANRSFAATSLHALRHANKAFWLIVSGTLLLLGMVVFVPVLRDLFRFGAIEFASIFVCVLAALLSWVWYELMKHFLLGRYRSESKIVQ